MTERERKEKAIRDLCLRLVQDCHVDVGCCAIQALEPLRPKAAARNLERVASRDPFAIDEARTQGRVQDPSESQPVVNAAGVAGLWADYEWLNIRWPRILVDPPDGVRGPVQKAAQAGGGAEIKWTETMVSIFASVPVT